MEAMEAELAVKKKGKARPSPSKPSAVSKGQGKKATVEIVDEDEDEDKEGDILAAMDAELKAVLEREGINGSDDDEGDEEPDYAMIKNFLESFKSQAGLSGPVSNLAGRLQPGWALPRDN